MNEVLTVILAIPFILLFVIVFGVALIFAAGWIFLITLKIMFILCIALIVASCFIGLLFLLSLLP